MAEGDRACLLHDLVGGSKDYHIQLLRNLGAGVSTLFLYGRPCLIEGIGMSRAC